MLPPNSGPLKTVFRTRSILNLATTASGLEILFLIGLICYLFFLVGYRTKVFHVFSLVFFHSVLSRNHLILNGGDMVLLTMLVWSVFLPLGERFSIDCLKRISRKGHEELTSRSKSNGENKGRSAPSLAGLIVMAQITLIYFLSAVTKSGGTWRHGTALYYTLNIDQISLPLGQWLAERPLWSLKILTWGALGLEYAVLPLILLPFGQPLLRRIAIVGTTCLHLGIWLTLNIGTFPLVMISINAVLLDSALWDRAASLRALTALPRQLWTVSEKFHSLSALIQCYAWNLLGRRDVLRRVKSNAVPPGPALFKGRKRFWRLSKPILSNASVAVIFICVLIDSYNLNVAPTLERRKIYEPTAMRAILWLTQLRHDWHLFAPNPIRVDGWFVFDGVTAAGQHVDPLTGRSPEWAEPLFLASNNNRFWRKYLYALLLKKNRTYASYFAQYLVKKYEQEHMGEDRLVQLDFYFVLKRTLPPYSPKPFPTKLTKFYHMPETENQMLTRDERLVVQNGP